MIIYQFPTNVVLDRLTQEYVVERAKLIGQTLLPDQNEMVQIVQWDEIAKELGLTRAHALGADVKIDKRPGSKVRQYTPGYFKAGELIKEDELLGARAFATLGSVVNIDNLVARRLRARIDKDYLTKEKLIWDCLQGHVSMVTDDGVSIDETFPIQIYPAAGTLGWDNHGNATPLKDFNAIKLLYRGMNATARGAKCYLNQTTMNHLLENINDDDIRGFRSQNFLSLTFSLEEMNKIMDARGLPTFEVYEEGYYDADGDFQLFIPDSKAVLIGKRNVGVTGDFALTPSLHRTVNGMPAPGMFSMINVNGEAGTGSFAVSSLGSDPNPRVQVTTGFYGGPRLYYPKDIVLIEAY